MVVFVITWTDTCDDLGIICTDPHKRGLGTFILVPVAKVLRASADIVTVLSHEPAAFLMARSVFGLLGHILDALGLSPSLSYGLFNQYKEGNLEPSDPLVLNDRTRAACDRWLERLLSEVCSSFSPSARGEQARYLGPTQVSVHTDASEEGLCGFCHGHYFRIDLTAQWAVLPMPVLEFVAFYGGVLAFHQLIRGFKVSLFTDSSLVASIAYNGRARSELMQLVHTALLSSAEWRGVAPSAKATYLTTEANAFSENAQAGVHARPASPPAAVPLLLDTCGYSLCGCSKGRSGRARARAHRRGSCHRRRRPRRPVAAGVPSREAEPCAAPGGGAHRRGVQPRSPVHQPGRAPASQRRPQD
jgi:hypothetical protein